jgi:hypothetical protein
MTRPFKILRAIVRCAFAVGPGRKCSTLLTERAVTSATALAERRSRRRAGDGQFVLRRQPRPIGGGDRGSAVRRPPGDLGHGHQPRLRIRYTDDDHALVQERAVEAPRSSIIRPSGRGKLHTCAHMLPKRGGVPKMIASASAALQPAHGRRQCAPPWRRSSPICRRHQSIMVARTKFWSSKYLTDVFDKSLSVLGVVIVSFSVFSRSALPLDSRESVARSEVEASRQATERHERLGLDGASAALSFASCGMDGD